MAMSAAEMIRDFECTVEEDPDSEGFFSIFAYRSGSGWEVCGKMGERAMADHVCAALNKLALVA